MRKTIIAGNWKMNTDRGTAMVLAADIAGGLAGMSLPEGLEIVLCPPYPVLPLIADVIAGGRIKLGAQNVHNRPSGAFTGEVSGTMLVSVGCAYVIVGHSERRMMLAESDLDVSYKANAAVDAGLRPIICVGETISEREGGHTEDVLNRQVRAALDGLFEFNVRSCVIAYEPIWAIGTDNPATPEQAEAAHGFIREVIGDIYSEQVARDIPIIYGGSMKPEVAGTLLSQKNIDGGLVGGASLDASSFLDIIRAA